MPCRAAAPVPTMIAAGVARPSAHGQAITSTATAFTSAVSAPAPASHQPPAVSTAMAITAGTNTALTRSTSRCTGGFWPCASPTSRTSCASRLSAPSAVASTTSSPSPFTAPPVTGLPACLATGRLSPVSRLSSTPDSPSRTTPSAAMRSPGRITSRSPRRSAATETSSSTPPRRMRARSGRSRSSAWMAAPACRRARASSHLPSRTRAITAADASKYSGAPCPASSDHTDSPNAADVPSATSVSIVPLPPRAACQAPR